MVCLLEAVDDIHEGGLQAGATNQEAVNVGLLAQLLAVLLADTATVQDARLVRSLVTNALLEPLADGSVDVLCLLSCGDLASADGPDGLVGNDDLGPVAGANLGLEGIQLLGNDGNSRASFAFLEGLTAAPDNADAVVDRVFSLGGDGLVRLAQDCPPLAVAKDSPFDTTVKQLRNRDLAGEGTVGLVVYVLRSNFNLLAQLLADEMEVQSCGRDNDLYQ